MNFINKLKGRIGFGSRTKDVNKEVMRERKVTEQKYNQAGLGCVTSYNITPRELWNLELLYSYEDSIDIKFKDKNGNNYKLFHKIEKYNKSPWTTLNKTGKRIQITLKTETTENEAFYNFTKMNLSTIYEKNDCGESIIVAGIIIPGKDHFEAEFLIDDITPTDINYFLSRYEDFFDEVQVKQVVLKNVSRKTYEQEFFDKIKWKFESNER
jgi:hypothetical protein